MNIKSLQFPSSTNNTNKYTYKNETSGRNE